ncbi:hypothetical protein FGO68_gene5000 [Halteria grandinella]|uniref:Uncharacterized protein n=1 Tax=Halteria grandinella TaxID=5974 RepID=A0A8J8NBX8_HALGN|nr:hypothetical protein FGO68_gene5000 [Halteria grandinella]
MTKIFARLSKILPERVKILAKRPNQNAITSNQNVKRLKRIINIPQCLRFQSVFKFQIYLRLRYNLSHKSIN